MVVAIRVLHIPPIQDDGATVVHVGRHLPVLNDEPDVALLRGLADLRTPVAMLDADLPGVFVDRPAVPLREAD